MKKQPVALMAENEWMIPPEKHIVLRTSYLKMWLRCPAQAMFRYHKGIVTPNKSYTTFGTCMHSSAEHQNKYKLKKGRDSKLSVLQDVFNETWKEKAKNTHFTKEEDQDEIKQFGIKKCLPVYYHQLATKLEPTHVEEPFSIEFPEVNATITGTIDLVVKGNIIRDLKNVSKMKNWLEVIKSMQAVSYTLGYESTFGKQPKGFVLDFLLKKKEQPELKHSDLRQVQPHETQEFVQLVYKIVTMIRRGFFFPKRENNHLCSPAMCGYWHICTKGAWMESPQNHRLFMGNDGAES